jgi:hypothetical protein
MQNDRRNVNERRTEEAERAGGNRTAQSDSRTEFAQTSVAADGQGTLGKDPSRPADSAAALDSGPAVSTGASTRPRGSAGLRRDASFDTAGRSGADTGAGSHSKEGRASEDRDIASGALRDHGEAGSATAGQDRLTATVFGGPLDPALAGKPIPEPQDRAPNSNVGFSPGIASGDRNPNASSGTSGDAGRMPEATGGGTGTTSQEVMGGGDVGTAGTRPGTREANVGAGAAGVPPLDVDPSAASGQLDNSAQRAGRTVNVAGEDDRPRTTSKPYKRR